MMILILKKTIKPVCLMLMMGLIGTLAVGCQNSATTAEGISEPSPTVEEPSIPQPNENGDYLRFQYTKWKVVEADPNGLNCRMSNKTYDELVDPRNNAKMDIGNWSVIGTLKQGQQFQVKLGPAGMGAVYDSKNKPWAFVEVTENASTNQCFVRANQKFVEPVSQ